MSDQQQPEYVWSFPEPKRRTGRVWLIVVLALVAVGVAVALFWFFGQRGDGQGTPAPSPSASSATPTPSSTPTVTPTESATPDPVPSSPAPVDPDLGTFRDRVQPLLGDADTGLGLASQTSGQDAAQIVDQLQQDAQRLSDTPAPGTVADEWTASAADYQRALAALRTAYTGGGDAGSALETARSALGVLRSLVGL